MLKALLHQQLYNLSDKQLAFWHIARTQARVEHIFAAIHLMGGKGVRTIGLARANLQLCWKATETAVPGG